MGYSNILEVEQILGQALTSASPDTTDRKFNLIDIGNVRDLNRISNEIVEAFIILADSQIDGGLSQMYQVPLKECANGQWDLDADINEYNQTVEVTDATNLIPGDRILIRNDDTGDEFLGIVNEVIDGNSFTTIEPIDLNFEGDNIRVLRIKFPPPVNQISARLAAAFIFDKYFSSQVSPNVSDYGNKMRQVAIGQLNDILNGKVILPCQRRVGDRWGNSYLDSSYSHRTPVDGYNTSDRNLSDQSGG